MLDGLLGRGFASKCKSLIKTTKNRIDVNRRKKNATLKFLKKDMADLLANGLDINAYGRAEGLLDELRGIWCYDFIEQCCDFLLKHLSIMEKIRHCPEDCREAVSSLMSAAARFSELPELRDLRDTFYERYGNSVELFVNQEFMENSSSKFFTKEKKVQLMQDIASEFSIKWDRKACEQIMSKTPAFVKDQPKKYGSSHMDADKYKSTFGKQTVLKGDEHGVLPTERLRPDNGGYQSFHRAETNVRDRNEHQPRHEGLNNGYKPFNIKEESNLKKDILFPGREEANLDRYGPGKEDSPLKVVRSGTSSQRAKESYSGGSKMQNRVDTVPIRDGRDGPSHGKPDISQHRAGLAGDYIRQNKMADAMRDVQEPEVHEPKPYRNNSAIPPPYTKSNVEPTGSKHATSLVSPHTTSDNNVVPTAPPFHNRTKAGNRSERVQEAGVHNDHNRKGIESTRENSTGNETRNYYEQDGIVNSIPRPRYTRRKHSKSRSSNDDASNLEDMGVVKRRSRSRRRNDPKKGLQILVDDDHYEDEEERMIDKLLLHYSKKPAAEEPGMVRRKSKSRDAHHQGSDADKSSQHIGRHGHDETSGKVFPPRSVSLPRDQATPSESTKNFTRAASFQPDRSPARHVHPKLPDYDDLAARFAALKGR